MKQAIVNHLTWAEGSEIHVYLNCTFILHANRFHQDKVADCNYHYECSLIFSRAFSSFQVCLTIVIKMSSHLNLRELQNENFMLSHQTSSRFRNSNLLRKLREILKVHNSKVCLALLRSSSLSIIPKSHFNLRKLVERCQDATDMPDLGVYWDEPSVSNGNNDSDNSWPTKKQKQCGFLWNIKYIIK